MSMLSMNRSIAGALVAVAAVFGSPAHAQDADPIDVAKACNTAVRTVASNTSDDMRQIRNATVREVRALDADGAEDSEIVAAGNEGRQDINARAATGVSRISTIVDNCLTVLDGLDTPAWVEARVIQTGANSISRINAVRDRSTDAVVAAVRAALDG